MLSRAKNHNAALRDYDYENGEERQHHLYLPVSHPDKLTGKYCT